MPFVFQAVNQPFLLSTDGIYACNTAKYQQAQIYSYHNESTEADVCDLKRNMAKVLLRACCSVRFSCKNLK